MPLEPPQLDDRRFEDIVAEARALIPRYTREWTDQNESDGMFFKMREDPRVFPFGRLLRFSSLDELPREAAEAFPRSGI